MRRLHILCWLAGAVFCLTSCGDDPVEQLPADVAIHGPDGDATEDMGDAHDELDNGGSDHADSGVEYHDPFPELPETERWSLPCLEHPVQVIRTANDHPHILAQTETDLQCAHGFVAARDRYFIMELARRNGETTLSELIGDVGLELDITNRSTGLFQMAQQLYAGMEEDGLIPEVEAYAEGINAYLAYARQGDLPIPAEFEFAYLLLGYRHPEDLLFDWSAASVAGAGATLLSQASFDRSDIAFQAALDDLARWGTSFPDMTRRQEGVIDDIMKRIAPNHAVVSAFDWDKSGPTPGGGRRLEGRVRLERGALERALDQFGRLEQIAGRQHLTEFGSNAWVVAPEQTADGVTLLASDGHLALTSPTTFFSMHLDTQYFGGGETHAIGLTFPGIPLVVLGTNGDIAWSQTQLLGDVVDWYREVLVLEDGRPVATRFQGTEHPLVVREESYQVSRALGSIAGERTIERYETSDGRFLVSIEGVEVDDEDDDPLAINVSGLWVVPQDVDGDEEVTALSVAYSGHYERGGLSAYRGFSHSSSVQDFMDAHSRSAALGAHFHAADREGGILNSGFQAMPCREYLLDEEGRPLPGGDPTALIDGTQFPSFVVTRETDGTISTGDGDPTTCMYSYDEFPHGLNPARGFLLSGNNDPSGATFDNDLWNDAAYIGGRDFSTGYRARRIEEVLEAGAGEHDVASMMDLQADHQASLARDFVPFLLEAIDVAQGTVDQPELEGSLARIGTIYARYGTAIDEAEGRLVAWQAADYWADSGVETFYSAAPSEDERANAVATMIFHAYFDRFAQKVFDDEDLPESLSIYNRGLGRTQRSLYLFLTGRGENNPEELSSWHPERLESVFFDDVRTEWTESSDELMVAALAEALDYLASEDLGDGAGGFGTRDQDTWVWGLKHLVRFPSIVTSYLGDDFAALSSALARFSITTDILPLADSLLETDPRASLSGFPRPGATLSVDAAGAPVTFGDFSYDHGPVMRIVVALSEEGPEGYNVIPGGQSGFPDDEHYADIARLWLGNEYYPMLFDIEDVLEAAEGREVLVPGPVQPNQD
ncbi:MAG: penicillin acylase family protein [Myxococcales bacterium]|nr:penicillin acylase family protein [Myxococcales bacterium]